MENTVILIGKVMHINKIKVLDNGQEVVEFEVETWNKRSEKTYFTKHKVTAWGRSVKTFLDEVVVGDIVSLRGELFYRSNSASISCDRVKKLTMSDGAQVGETMQLL